MCTHTRWSFTNTFIWYNFMTKEPWNNVPHGPGLTTSHHHLFPQLKKRNLGDKFQDNRKVKQSRYSELYWQGIQQLVARYDKCLIRGRDCTVYQWGSSKTKSQVLLLKLDMNNQKYVYMNCKLIFWPSIAYCYCHIYIYIYIYITSGFIRIHWVLKVDGGEDRGSKPHTAHFLWQVNWESYLRFLYSVRQYVQK
jgi:hypothetical protein